MNRIRVLIVDDHPLMRAGIRGLLEYSDDIEVVAEAQNGRIAVDMAKGTRPDVVIMDIAMAEMNGIEATTLIRSQLPEVKVLVLTQYEKPQYIEPLLAADASGFITKRAAGTDLVTAIRAVAAGEMYIHPSMGRLVAYQARAWREPPKGTKLTPREVEVLALIVRGQKNSQIARELSLSVKTVEWHRSNLMRKLDTHGTADLVRFAIEHALLPGDQPQLP